MSNLVTILPEPWPGTSYRDYEEAIKAFAEKWLPIDCAVAYQFNGKVINISRGRNLRGALHGKKRDRDVEQMLIKRLRI